MFAYNNYSSALTWWTHQGDATYHSLQALFKTRYKRSQMTAAYTWSHSIANVIMDDSSGGLGYQSYMYSGNPALDRGNSAINRPHIFTANFNYYLPDLNQANHLVKGAFGGWELGLITTDARGNSVTAYQNGLSENGALQIWPTIRGRSELAIQQQQHQIRSASAGRAWPGLQRA